MRVSFVGGHRDGVMFDIPTPLPPAMRIPVPAIQSVAAWASDDPTAVVGSFEVATYRLATSRLDHRQFYVEEGVLERWRDIESLGL